MDDFDRDVHCLLGLPLDAVDMAEAQARVREAARLGTPCFVSTPNLNFLVASLADPAFRDSVVNSDLSITDGLPLVWMARWLGMPIRGRVTGSGLFETLSHADGTEGLLSVYFLGGEEGVAESACQALNRHATGLRCIGSHCPGFGTVGEMSDDATIARINASGADFLVVSLGARKGQAWIERNRARLSVPVISHLGAVVNFVAGSVRRAPRWIQQAGLEWLWRIKEEPALWRRYWHDGIALAGLLLTRLLPYALWLWLRRIAVPRSPAAGMLHVERDRLACRLSIVGDMTDPVPEATRQALREAARAQQDVVLDCARAGDLSPGFFGLLLMLRKHQAAAGRGLAFTNVSASLRRQFRWNGVEHLLAEGAVPQAAAGLEQA